MHQASVVLGMEDVALQEEVLHFLERLPRVRVVAAAEDAVELARQVRDRRPDAAVVTPSLAERSNVDGASVLVVDGSESTSALRAALRAGARGFYLWPEEREALALEAERAARPRREPVTRGRVIAVFAPRGGAGTTFLATNLAAACADRGADTVLADLDPFYADVTVALGVEPNGAPTVADLAPVADELTDEHLERILHRDSRGFRVLLAPHRPLDEGLDPRVVSAALAALRAEHDLVIAHLPRTLDEGTRAALAESDFALVVVTLDVIGLRDARRALDVFRTLGMAGRCRLVLNRVGRGEIVPADAEGVLGLGAVAVIREDRAVRKAQDRGELVVGRSTPAGRRVAALARRLLEESTE
jgi:pilus assembly protein CpaE